MEKPEGRQSKYGFSEMKQGETIQIKMKNGEQKTKVLNSIRARCAQETNEEKKFVAWADMVGIYYKREI